MEDHHEGIVFHIEEERPLNRGGIQLVQVGLQAHFIPPNLSREDAYVIIADRARRLLRETVEWHSVVMPPMDEVGFYVEGRSDEDHAIVANQNNVIIYRNITAGLFEGLFENVLQSQENIQLENIMWYFTVDPNNLFGGGAEKVSRPSYIRKKWMYSSWVGYEDIGCAAFAISATMKNQSTDRHNRLDYIKRKAIEIQEKLGWEKVVSPLDVLRFVDHEDYKDYAIGILCQHLVKNPISSHFYREGENYDYEFDSQNGFKNRIYICLDHRQNHYGCVDKLALANPTKISAHDYSYPSWCNICHCAYYYAQNEKHRHGEPVQKRQKTEETAVQKKCQKCKQVYLSSTKHLCPTYQCKICKSTQQRNSNNHRCPLLPSDFKIPKKKKDEMMDIEATEEDDDEEQFIEFVTTEAQLDKGYFGLFAYDFESCIDIKKRKSKQIIGFELDENGQYKLNQDGRPVLKELNGVDYTFDYAHHRVNLICYKNVFLNEPVRVIKDFSTIDTKQGILEFIHFALTYNHGNNMFYAHNASGYDSRLLFQALQELNIPAEITPVTRGGKFIQITVKRWVILESGERKLMKTIFKDSMLHLGGSLKSLAIDFCEDVGIEKGHFPHLFNRPENFAYCGPLPSLDDFDFTFSAKSKKEYEDCIKWWKERNEEGVWKFEDEIIKYCINDVEILVEVMKKFHNITVDWFNYSPW